MKNKNDERANAVWHFEDIDYYLDLSCMLYMSCVNQA